MSKVNKIILNIIKWIIAIMFILLTLVIFVQIISRYFFEFPLAWSEELALTLMVWITFLGSAVVLETHDHITIDFLVEKLSERMKSLLRLINFVLLFALFSIFVFGGWIMIETTKNSITPGMQISSAWLYGGVFTGGILLSITTLRHFVSELKRFVSISKG
ncbi:TRAP transporter small permease [Virgibacillus byunsanensis]|uniref:TRAP transporter small permease n=1 Tax=Virgibacillus byunsanensis TaxID=570945 RepID=A0ABW3LQV0_9BACI